ncbi:hypothetical protein [Streptomyces gobiensis]|uniref:hypothetical protein n=1 Tax=Streptomyces gobiensis TaxID=2875706 RepID=UPI001E5BBEA5|nr:hypothetical protein [Streptomyces gobiensis]UGY91252.1 hypothetical protein test1122_05655 [Streptomyces gobiensis]
MGVNTGRMRKWLLAAVGVNLLLGIPGVVPVWLLWYFAVNWPLAAVGWTQREPTENDGMLPWLLIGVPVLTLFALVWWLANRPVRRRTELDPRLYWPVGVLMTLAPSIALMIVL